MTWGYALSRLSSITSNKELHKQAIEKFNKTIVLNNKSEGAYRGRGFSYFHIGNFEAAKNDFNRALAIHPSSCQAHFLLGLLSDELGDNENAKKEYEKCVTFNKNFFQAYNQLGRLYRQEALILKEQGKNGDEQFKKAIVHYLKSIFYSKGQYILAYSNLGRVYSETDNLDKAIKSLSIAISKSPNYAEAFDARGYAFNKAEKFKEAKEDLEKAITINPTLGSAYNHLAYTYQQLGDKEQYNDNIEEASLKYKEAIKYSLKALNFPASRKKALLRLAIINEQIFNKINEAREYFKTAIREYPESFDVIHSYIVNLRNFEFDWKNEIEFLKTTFEKIKSNELHITNNEIIWNLLKIIQTLVENKYLNSDIIDLLRTLEILYPDIHLVNKEIGLCYLHKSSTNQNFDEKMHDLKIAEKELDKAIEKKTIADKKASAAYFKYKAKISGEICLCLQGQYQITKDEKLVNEYKKILKKTKSLFDYGIKEFKEYPEINKEFSIFLYRNKEGQLAKLYEQKAKELFLKQIPKHKDKKEVERELEEIKKYYSTENE